MAVLAIGALGAWLAPVGYASLGFSIGSTLGGMLFAPKRPDTQGPRLGDLKVQASTYGNPVPKVYGAIRIAGNMIWAADITETAHVQSSGGKGGGGGGTSTSYTYSQSFAIAICEGEIAGVRKIWANGKLIYNVGDSADLATIAASNGAASGITFYNGSETQVANSLIQAHVGAADTPAYRGTAYVVFNNLQLETYGNRTPNIEFEVLSAASYVNPNATMFTLEGIGLVCPQIPFNGVRFAIPHQYGFALSSDCTSWTQVTYGEARLAQCGCAHNGSFIFAAYQDSYYGPIINARTLVSVNNGASWTTHFQSFAHVIVDMASNGTVIVGSISYDPASGETNTVAISSDGGVTFNLSATLPVYGTWGKVTSGAGGFVMLSGLELNNALYSSTGLSGWSLMTLPYTRSWAGVAYGNGTWVTVGGLDSATSTNGTTWVGHPNAFYGMANAIRFDTQFGKFILLTQYKMYSSSDGAMWEEFGGAIAVYGFGCANGIAVGMGYYTTTGYHVSEFRSISASVMSLSTIVSDICTRAGLLAEQIDVTQLTEDVVDGYVVQHSTARSQLEQLMQTYYFDCIESDGKVKFVKRGGASVATITEDDLAAHAYGSSPSDTLVTHRKQEMELPISVAVQYLDSAAAYAIGSQSSSRLTTNSENTTSLNFAIAMSATKAKQVADVLMFDTWTGRTTFDFTTSWKYSWLEPTDIVTIVKDGAAKVCRIVDEDVGGGISKRVAVLDDSNVYSQTAAAAILPTPTSTVRAISQTNLVLLDIPLLRDQDDGVGFYAAACGYTSPWSGSQVFKSNDAGLTYGAYGNAILSAATMGSAAGALGNFTQNIFDELNTVSVSLTNGALASDTEINVLNGANAALLGDEIICFRDATLTGTNTYTLSGLLRGQKGTEWAAATHTAGDRFVLLNAAMLSLLPAATAEYDLVRHYKGVSIGGWLSDARQIAFTNTAVAQTPLSPVQLSGGRNANLDVVLTWTRRSRISGGWNNFADVPLGEASEAYEVEIWDSAYTVLKRTITGITTQTTTYTAAQQTTDFGSTQTTVYFKAFQLSSTVGRGFEARGTA